MKNILLKIGLITLSSFLINTNSKAQGCGDAGACSIDAMSVSLEDSSSTYKNSFKIGATYGAAQYDITIISPYIEYSRVFSDRFKSSIKLSSSTHMGDVTNTSGFSDLYLTGNYLLVKSLNVVGGIKFPLSKGNMKYNDLALPMSYQTSLGTTDLILGLSYQIKNFSFYGAYQKPLVQNDNQFLLSEYKTGDISSNYRSTNGYIRQDDILFRASYTYRFFQKKFALISSLLPIYHLGEDRYINELNQEMAIAQSEGLTFNVNLFLQIKLSEKSALELSFGAPLKTRKTRPDGLTALSIGLEYAILF